MRFFAAWAVLLCFDVNGFAQSGMREIANQAAADGRRGDYTAAANKYRELLQKGADSAELRSNLGMMLYLCGDTPHALKELHVALSRNPKLVAANLFTGRALLRSDRPRKALGFLHKAEEEQPSASAPLLALGRTYIALHDLSQALNVYRKATSIDPGNAEAWYGRGVLSREMAGRILKQVVHSS
ncbi:MAG: tetratricopeptide repeat protein, partial [Candidatus Micrarchaeaceae archaeon]